MKFKQKTALIGLLLVSAAVSVSIIYALLRLVEVV
jgi:hypothetical protein